MSMIPPPGGIPGLHESDPLSRELTRARALDDARREPPRQHPFAGDGSGYCTQCRLPLSNRLHQVGQARTRLVLSLDHEQGMLPADVEATLLHLLASSPDLVVVDVQVLR